MKLNKYDVLADLDIETNGNDNAKNVASWINALSDGEYLSRFNYNESIVNDAVKLLERLNERTQFIIFDADSGVVDSCNNGFDSLMETLDEIADNDTEKTEDTGVKPNHYTIMAVVPFRGNAYVIRNETARDCINDLDIYQLINILF